MGKNMYTRHVDEEVELDKLDRHIHPSCMWGFVHAMDYHQWHFNFKRMLLQKINPRKHAKGKRSSKTKQLVHDPRELQKLLTEEEKHLHSAKESSSKHKRSLKTRIKSLIAEENSKEENHKHWASSFSPQPKLQRTYSIHHLESPYYGLGEACTDWEHPIIFFPGNKNTGATKTKAKNVTDKPGTRGTKSEKLDASKAKFKEHVNVLEIFKVDEDLFLEIVQDKDGSLRKFSHTLPVSDAKARLAKSGSFPAPNLSQKRNLGPSTLKQKQTEIWSAPSVDKFKYSKFVRSKSLPLEYSMRGGKLGQALNFVLETTNKSDEGNSEVLVTSKESKQSMQFEVEKGGDEGESSSLCSTIEKDSSKRCEKTATSRVEEHSFSSCETEEHCLTQNMRSHRRSSSLNESLDKYTWLFENNFGKEVKLHPSRSLKLRNEYEMGSGGNVPIVFRRIRSLSNADIYSSLQNVVYGDANPEDWSITTVEKNGSREKYGFQDELKPEVLSPITEENVPPRHIEDSVHQKELLERDGSIHQMDSLAGSRENITCDYSARVEDLEEEAHALTVGKSNSYMQQVSDCSAISSTELTQTFPVPAYETDEEEVSSSVEFQIPEVVLENRCDDFDENDYSINSKKSFGAEPSSWSSSTQNLENLDIIKDSKLGGSFENYDADSDLEYVKDILENSGIAEDAFHRTWHSSNQLLDPSIFDEMEAYWHKEFSGEDYCGCYHHQLLFDLVNEKLVQIYNRSFTYYPKALSSSCHIRPFPVGDRIVDEICTSVSASMSLNPAQMRSLESLVALDMGKDDGWMNLQSESECRGLELEDMILDELLEELICS